MLLEITADRFQEIVSELSHIYPKNQLGSVYDPLVLQAAISRYTVKPLAASGMDRKIAISFVEKT